MKTHPLGKSNLLSTRLIYGNMRTAGTWKPDEATAEKRAKGVASHIAAYEAGYNHFDSADIYCHGVCEQILGETLKQVSGMRDRILITTKVGIRFPGDPNPDSQHRYDFSAEHILKSADISLKNLGVETIDVYLLHRPDLLMNPPEIAKAFDKLKAAGKVRHFGVSNFTPSYLSLLSSYLPFPLLVNQVEIHLGRLDCFTDGTLDQCFEKKITPTAWSPLGGGWLGHGKELDPNHARFVERKKVIDLLDQTAVDLGVSRTVVSLAWLMKHPSGIMPIIGSNNPDNIRDAAKADTVELTREQWYRILVAARGKNLP